MRRKGKTSRQLTIKAIDFFCGVGGVTRGLLDAGIDVICGIDNDPTARQTFEQNNIRSNGQRVEFLEQDINHLRFSDIKVRLKAEKYDRLIFVGCAPCQPFTNINTAKDKTKSQKSYLLKFGDFVKHFKPDFLFIENVPGITSSKYGAILGIFKKRLQELDYRFADANLNAKRYGIPQNRNRRILIASKHGPISFPSPTHGPGKLNYLTVRNVLTQHRLTPLGAGQSDNKDSLHRAANLSATNLWRIRHTPKDGGGRKIWMKKKPVKCFKRHKDSYRDVYNRMYWKRPAPTITTRFNSLSNGRFGHPEQDRAISLREGALFQTFPTNYVFLGSMGNIARHIGNAVPVELAKIFGLHFVELTNNKGH
jgi:DNA (cytosine-5)-methyltransferase 1